MRRPGWTTRRALTPVGKAYFGFTDEELKQIDRFVRGQTIERFGPVRSLRAESHAGVAMRFPRIDRIRWDKPPGEADELVTLERMLEQMEAR